jgi:N6-L-threonylcarbamoyladenine synthase
MKILGIETSCDETSIALIDATEPGPRFSVISHITLSQIKMHEQYGGVFPNLAQREHQKNLVPLLLQVLQESGENSNGEIASAGDIKKVITILDREPILLEAFLQLLSHRPIPNIDAIAVTHGPGLEPALWTGVNFAKALSTIWGVPVIPVNHMEGHIVSVLLPEEGKEAMLPSDVKFPALALLVSGGHTELVLMARWGAYKRLGETRDDAVGEAFDKVARMLSLPYPGGPQISRLAEEERKLNPKPKKTFTFPRPMMHSKDYDFSFAGIKTSVLYTIKKLPEVTPEIRREIAREFEDSVVEVLVSKTTRAIEEFGPRTLIVGGGVSANKHLREACVALKEENTQLEVFIPTLDASGDNAAMIAIAGYLDSNAHKNKVNLSTIKAEGNLRL